MISIQPRNQISKVMSKIVQVDLYIEPETSEMGKVTIEEQSWDRRFSVGKIKNMKMKMKMYFILLVK